MRRSHGYETRGDSQHNRRMQNANDACSSFTACCRPFRYGQSYTSLSCRSLWLAQVLRHRFPPPSPALFPGVHTIVSRRSSQQAIPPRIVTYNKIWAVYAQVIPRRDIQLAKVHFAAWHRTVQALKYRGMLRYTGFVLESQMRML